MKDYTVAVNELRSHYNELRAFRKAVRDQVKMEFEAQIDFEIKRRREAAEVKFANHLASVKERDNVPVRIIQDEVLRTRTWSVWEALRDRAGIVPEFTRVEDARAAKALANSPFRWADDFATLTVLRTSAGDTLTEPIIYDMTTNRKVHGKWWWPDPTTPENEVAERAAHTLDSGFKAHVSAEIQRQIDAGNIPGED